MKKTLYQMKHNKIKSIKNKIKNNLMSINKIKINKIHNRN